jgi:hypothetical protein
MSCHNVAKILKILQSEIFVGRPVYNSLTAVADNLILKDCKNLLPSSCRFEVVDL